MIDFMPRTDGIQEVCPNCDASGRDPKKRKRKCPQCNGHGKIYICPKCEKEIPCPCDEGKLY